MSMLFGSLDDNNGTWSFYSETDPRWKVSGETWWQVSGGMCPDAERKLKELEQRLGPRPTDLEYSFYKY